MIEQTANTLIVNYGLAGILIAYVIWDRKTIMEKILEVIEKNNEIVAKNTYVLEKVLMKFGKFEK